MSAAWLSSSGADGQAALVLLPAYLALGLLSGLLLDDNQSATRAVLLIGGLALDERAAALAASARRRALLERAHLSDVVERVKPTPL